MTKLFSNLGNEYGKPDMERLGIFSELPYMNGKGYVPIYPNPRPEKREKYDGGGKPPRFKNVSERPMFPPAAPKLHSTPGDHYGTFGGKIEAFSNVRHPKPPYRKEPRQCGTSPVKKGGYGYVNTCLNPYPNHTGDRYGTRAVYKQYGINLSGPMRTTHFPKPFFDPNPYREPESMKPGPTYIRPKEKTPDVIPPGKIIPVGPAKSQGGCHAGCFESFPEYKPNKYITLFDLAYKPKKHVGGQFYPHSMAQKTFYTSSIMAENLRFKMNKGNYANYEPTYIKHLVD
ncbi:hypothetical protein NQ314_012898 [Rhamnusium bicolor]|uniref:Cilia-and flagella-associated protein 96 n=1 Tax=Rhamnusium bicolor TaxID=1586634 RepID=A0AAV8X8P2_9CUCU|nr:hypothetical protein NQ314_012898 [Rhamnusium bicolor]